LLATKIKEQLYADPKKIPRSSKLRTSEINSGQASRKSKAVTSSFDEEVNHPLQKKHTLMEKKQKFLGKALKKGGRERRKTILNSPFSSSNIKANKPSSTEGSPSIQKWNASRFSKALSLI